MDKIYKDHLGSSSSDSEGSPMKTSDNFQKGRKKILKIQKDSNQTNKSISKNSSKSSYTESKILREKNSINKRKHQDDLDKTNFKKFKSDENKENAKVVLAESLKIEQFSTGKKPLFSLPQRVTKVADKELDERLLRLMGDYQEPIVYVSQKVERQQKVEITQVTEFSVTKPESFKFIRQNPKAFQSSQNTKSNMKEEFNAPAIPMKKQAPLNAFQRRMNNMKSIKSSINKCNQVKLYSPIAQATQRLKMDKIEEFLSFRTPELVSPIAEVTEKKFSEIWKFFNYKVPQLVKPIDESRTNDTENKNLMIKLENFFAKLPEIIEPIEDISYSMHTTKTTKGHHELQKNSRAV